MSAYEYILPLHRDCPNCGFTATMTDFRPDPGYDPRMREYECTICHYTWFYIQHNVTLRYAPDNTIR